MKILFIHDNHVVRVNEDFAYANSTFHLFLRAFKGLSDVELSSPHCSDGAGYPPQLVIDDVTVRIRPGYQSAARFYRRFLAHTWQQYRALKAQLVLCDAAIVAGPACSALPAFLAAKVLKKPLLGYVIGNNVAVVANNKEYGGLRRLVALAAAHWEWFVMRLIAREHITICLGTDLQAKLGVARYNARLGMTSTVRDSDIIERPGTDIPRPAHVLTVGRLSPEKGIEFALMALAKLIRNGNQFKYTVIGEGPQRIALIQTARTLGIEEHVTFAGQMNHDRVRSAYQSASVFLLPSLTEGVPKVLLEAMAAGVPVIATRVGGAPQLLGNGNRGWLVAPKSSEEIAAALIESSCNEELRERKRAEAYGFIRQHTAEACARHVLTLVEEEMSKARKRT